jgi:hypothetical protein
LGITLKFNGFWRASVCFVVLRLSIYAYIFFSDFLAIAHRCVLQVACADDQGLLPVPDEGRHDSLRRRWLHQETSPAEASDFFLVLQASGLRRH